MSVSRKLHSETYYVGIDAGSVSLNCIVINHNKEIVFEFPYKRHFGRVEEEVLVILKELSKKCGNDTLHYISFTGNHGKKLSEKLGTFYEFETITQVLGVLFVTPNAKTIISMGGARHCPFSDQALQWRMGT